MRGACGRRGAGSKPGGAQADLRRIGAQNGADLSEVTRLVRHPCVPYITSAARERA
jgi:hypothetical protein